MLDFSHLPTSTSADVQVFGPTEQGITAGTQLYQPWQRPRGVSMVAILCVGTGGNGGNGAVGAIGSAAGGGGGGSGGITFVVVPADRLPQTLFCRVAANRNGVGNAVVLNPAASVGNEGPVAFAGHGGSGGNASGGTAGTAGTAAAASSVASSVLAGIGVYNFLAGQAGAIGATNLGGNPITLPTNGLTVTGGASGGGMATAGGSKDGGSFVVSGAFPNHSGGIGSLSDTLPAGNGSNGYDMVIPGLRYSYGGAGGGATTATATGAGLFGGNGGVGGIGCGGGGGGACFTGGVAGVGGRGGPGQIIIISW